MAINELHGIVCTVNGAGRTPPGKTEKPTTVDIYLEKDNQKYKTVPVSRRFLSRLTQAHETILRYRAAPNARGLAECVKKLESLSFEDIALQLEERELKAHPDFRREFEQAFE